MAAPITKKYSLSAKGILIIDDEAGVGLEITETGEFVPFEELMADFADRTVKVSVAYDEEYGVE